MNRLEFQKKAGIVVSEDQFEIINNAYMACSGMYKDEFCAEYGKNNSIKILEAVSTNCHVAMDANLNLIKEKKENAKVILNKAIKYNDVDLYNMAVSVLGLKSVILFKLKEAVALNSIEREYIADKLDE